MYVCLSAECDISQDTLTRTGAPAADQSKEEIESKDQEKQARLKFSRTDKGRSG